MAHDEVLFNRVHQNGLSVSAIAREMFANPVSAFFGMDVIVSSVVLWTFIYYETRKGKVKFWWLSVVGNLLVGVSLGFPLFLLLREFSKENRVTI